MRLLAAFLACVICTAALSQVDEVRTKNLAAAVKIVTEPHEGTAREALDQWLSTLPKEQAAQVDMDLLQGAVRDGTVREESPAFSREWLRIIRKYLPRDDAVYDGLVDFYGYRLVIDSKLERGEIPREERDYLVERKHRELQRVADFRSAEAEAQRLAKLRADFDRQQAADDAQRQAQAAADLQQQLMWANIIGGVGRSMIPPPRVNCQTTRIGATLNTTCR